MGQILGSTQSYAFTDEINIAGDIFLICGVTTKMVAVYNNDIRNIVVPKRNEKEVQSIKELGDFINVIYVNTINEVVDIVF